ncbi:MAG: hypothetical protein M1834_008438 [Cirrosporium novae-zelandiae]|nr:MAG: hypothetical protein M1834_008438 [Cirrosporium novae-zelandiae]
MFTTWDQNGDRTRRRSARSKYGCLTCRQRKVKCNEQKPTCSHCERLNLQCIWKDPPPTSSNRRRISPATSPPRRSAAPEPAGPAPFNEVFNYASFMWNDANRPSMLSNNWANLETPHLIDPSMANVGTWLASAQEPYRGLQNYHINQGPGEPDENIIRHSSVSMTVSSGLSEGLLEDNQLLDFFLQTVLPPILAPIETQSRWLALRGLLASMSTTSPMVRYAVMAFSALQARGTESESPTDYLPLYDRATDELATFKLRAANNIGVLRDELQYVLTTLFLLIYTDLVTGRVGLAHANLKEAHNILQKADKRSLTTAEKRLISWIRLVDARAVSAGGEGLFLSDDDEGVYAPDINESSPSSINEGGLENRDTEIEDMLFDILHQPGVIFFQRIQSFMGRISKIDQWHRSRGTVKDETEVMDIAAKISSDLVHLYEHRPTLMDHAVAGNLNKNHLAQNLAFTISRSFRTYLSNYHASFIHLHRVAYKHLPRTPEVVEAMKTIRYMARMMMEADGSLPVNMLWPLLMWGAEEEDLDDRIWIIAAIHGMESCATNAKITAEVLEEVQKRQDGSKRRVDVRQVMHEIFDSCFAIV